MVPSNFRIKILAIRALLFALGTKGLMLFSSFCMNEANENGLLTRVKVKYINYLI